MIQDSETTAATVRPQVAVTGALQRLRLLAALDPGTPSRVVGNVISAITCGTGASVRIVSVVPSANGWIDETGRPAWGTDHNPLRRRAVTHALASCCPAAARWPVMLRAGDVVSMIVAEAADFGADLVVLGLSSPRREPGIRHHVASRVLRRISTPVLAVAEGAIGAPERAVAAVDFTLASLRATRAILDIMADGGTLHLLHVRQDFAYGTSADARVRSGYISGIGAAFDRLLTELGPASSVSVRPTLVEGAPLEQLMKFADSVGADTIAVGGRRRESPVPKLGRIPTALAADASRSLLIAPPTG